MIHDPGPYQPGMVTCLRLYPAFLKYTCMCVQEIALWVEFIPDAFI